MSLVKGLYEYGWSGDDIRKLFRFIDWIMDLPKELEQSFWQDFHHYEEEKHMPYITSVERIGMEKAMEKGMEKGRKEGLVEAIGMDVVIKFPEEAAEIMELVKAIDDVDALRAALRAVKTANTPAEIRTALGAGVHQSKSS